MDVKMDTKMSQSSKPEVVERWLYTKLGFQYEGRLRRMVYTNGNFYDQIYYGMMVEEFDALDPKRDL
jgi:hypothetical protein